MIRVLIADDSPVVRDHLRAILAADPQIHVLEAATNGDEALALVERDQPDVIVMDVHMPARDGLEATRRIMETHPTPIVIVSATWQPHDADKLFRAIEAGALALAPKPFGLGHPEYDKSASELIRTVKLMSEVKVVRRWARARKTAALRAATDAKRAPVGIRLVAIGASTGGPPVLNTILCALPRDFAVPVLIVQHIATGFVQGLADWLARNTQLCIRLAANGDPALPGHVYLAPDGAHMGVTGSGRIVLSNGTPENGACPSVSHLLRSVAGAFGAAAVGVLLTGMGRDGADELKRLRDAGAITIAQDAGSSVVHGMPGEAIRLNGASYTLTPEEIAPTLIQLVQVKYANAAR